MAVSFDTIPHAALMTCLARRISDGRMLHLLTLLACQKWIIRTVVMRGLKG